MSNPFIPFGRAHIDAIVLALLVPAILAALVRFANSKAVTNTVRGLFAAELIAMYALWFWLLYTGIVGNALPMHLCDWAAIATIVTLIRPNQRSFELAYFWTFSGTLQATLTPELALGWPDLRFVIFFGFHCGVIAGVLYLMLGMRMRPYPDSLPRVIGWTVFYGIAAGTVDWITGANYGFLRGKPVNPSALDLLSPWPWYIAELVPIGIAFILVLYLPFFVVDRLRPHASTGSA
jgi:hypothetical integral membrane protein (TIGR02206 family)